VVQLETLVLTLPTCPDPDDAEIRALVELVARATASAWVVLEIRAEQPPVSARFEAGSPTASGRTVPLELAGPFAATLTVPEGSALGDPLRQLVGLSLDATLAAVALRRQALTLRAALDTTEHAVLLFNRAGDIVYANPPADRLLCRQTEDRLGVVCSGTGPQPLVTLLCKLVAEAVGPTGRPTRRSGSLVLTDGSTMSCEVVRLEAAGDGRPTGVLAVLHELTPVAERSVALVAGRYGLSQREQEVVTLVALGLATGEIADRLSISLHTVRDHLKHVYRKTSTGSRGQLLTLLTASAEPPLEVG
jgi:DNA-binding CsgD family transcriptional regulator/PAS domain-containing protein